MNLDYISSDKLVEFDVDRHQGTFVYLREDDGENKKGLYFGGDKWLLLSGNNIGYDNDLHVQIPMFPTTNTFNYTGEEIIFNPLNLDEIKDFVDIYNNVHSDAGIYKVIVSLKYYEWTWTDGTNEAKEFTFVIQPEHVTSATVQLSKQSCEFGEEIPYVVNVMYQDKILVKNLDYEVVYPELGNNVIKVNFIGNYEGVVKKAFNLIPKKIAKPKLVINSFGYTGDDIFVYPDNWDEISGHCFIENNSAVEPGKYTMYVHLKNTLNYCWEDNTILPVAIDFIIGTVEVPLPEWDYDYVYNVDFNGSEHVFLPTNYNLIRDYIIIENNKNINAGDYEIVVSLKDENMNWSDGSVSVKKHSYTINKKVIDSPVWNNPSVGYYNTQPYVYKPLNWDDISIYCKIENETQTNAGDYEVIVSLRDKVNYAWKTIAGIITSNDQIGNFTILKAEGFFVTSPYIHGNFYVDDDVYCVTSFVDSTCELTYEWYRNENASLKGATFITSSNINEYRITSQDVGYFLICNVIAKSTEASNYRGAEAFAVSRLKVAKTVLYDSFTFDPEMFEDSIPATQTTYTLPGVNRMSYDDGSVIEYKIVSGNDVAELWDIHDGLLMIKGIGDVVVEVSIIGSKNYVYVPDTIRFTLHVYSEDVVLWGLYDKESDTPENETLMSGLIPENAQRATLKENEKGVHSFLFRKQFPFRKFDGSEQDYYGWYVMIPFEKRLIGLDENGGSNMNVDELKLKNEDGSDLIVTTSENRRYKVYGKFNVAKTSDNWMLHILFRNY